MRTPVHALLFVFCLLFAGLNLTHAASAPAAPPASAPAAAPPAAPAAAGAEADVDVEPAQEPAAETAAEPAAEPTPPAEPSTLVADGLLAQLFARVALWFDSVSEQVAEAGTALADVRLLGQWVDSVLATEQARAAAMRGALVLAAIIIVGLAAEALAARLLRRPRRLIAQHADERDARARARAAAHDAELAAQVAAARETTIPGSAAGPATLTQVQAGMVEPEALAGPHPADTPPVAAATQPPGDGATLARAAAERLRRRRMSLHRWQLLGRLPWAFADAVLSLLPLVAFLAVVSLGVAFQGGEGSDFQSVVMPMFNAYVGVRVALAVVRLMVSPDAVSLRLAAVSDANARLLFRHSLAIATVAAVGIALGEVMVELGAGLHMRTLTMKLTSLLVSGMVIVLVVRTRASVRAVIRGERHGEGLAALRGFLAEIYPYAATAVIVTFWVVWALGVPNGFVRAVRFLTATTAVLAASRLIWIVIMGAIDRSFENANPRMEATLSHGVERYHGWLRGLVHVIVAVGTVVVLLQVWGFESLDWFAPGTVGRRLLSAAWTIGVAAVLAIVVWESVSLALRRRIEAWSARGDAVRAARLRTLVPMIRTCVLVAIAVVVVFTALTELGVNVAPLLAGASIIGVAIGFGSQKLVQDFITGIFLLMENAMQVGDNVTVAGVSGTVEYLSIRTVRLRAGDGSLHVIPFSSVSTVNNVNRGLGTAPVRLTLVPSTDIPAAYDTLRAISDAMQADPRFGPSMLTPLDIFGVDQIDGAGVTIAGQIRTTDKGRWPVQREFNRRVLEAVRQGRLTLANPRETLLAPAPAAKGTDE